MENIGDCISDVRASKCRKENKFVVPLSWGVNQQVFLTVLELD
jgi:hypothetical protein